MCYVCQSCRRPQQGAPNRVNRTRANGSIEKELLLCGTCADTEKRLTPAAATVLSSMLSRTNAKPKTYAELQLSRPQAPPQQLRLLNRRKG